MDPSTSPRPRRVFWVALALILAALTEGLARIVGAVAGPALDVDIRPLSALWAEQTAQVGVLLSDPTTMIALDPLLGWRYRPGYRSAVHHLDSAGHRSQHEYPAAAPPGRRRIAAFGDSFVYGNEVSTPEAWASQLEALHPTSLDVLNYGVGGYGTDQAMLLFLREGMRFGPEVVLIGFAPVNLSRIQNVYRRFVSTQEPPLVKPRFALSDSSGLKLLPNPLPDRPAWERFRQAPEIARELGRQDAWYDPLRYENPAYEWSAAVRLATVVGIRAWRRYLWEDRLMEGDAFRPASSSFGLQRAVLEAFADSVARRGAQPAYLFLPDRDDVAAVRAGRRPAYGPLRDSLTKRTSVPLLDLTEAFAAEPATSDIGAWFAPGGHYSPAGNAVVARWLARHPVVMGSTPGKGD